MISMEKSHWNNTKFLALLQVTVRQVIVFCLTLTCLTLHSPLACLRTVPRRVCLGVCEWLAVDLLSPLCYVNPSVSAHTFPVNNLFPRPRSRRAAV